jgi:hypothetical protein
MLEEYLPKFSFTMQRRSVLGVDTLVEHHVSDYTIVPIVLGL